MAHLFVKPSKQGGRGAERGKVRFLSGSAGDRVPALARGDARPRAYTYDGRADLEKAAIEEWFAKGRNSQ